MAIFDEQVPVGTDDTLSEYLFRQFRAARYEDEQSDQLARLTKLPLRPSVGRIYYFDNAIIGDPVITAEGMYLYKTLGYVFIA